MAVVSWPKETVSEDQWNQARLALEKAALKGPEAARWRALFTLARRDELRQSEATFGRALVREGATDLERLFATLGLARMAGKQEESDKSPTLADALANAAGDPEYRVRVEALRGLRSLKVGLRDPLRSAVLQDDSAHVRAAAVLALLPKDADPTPAAMLAKDPSPMVRRAAFEAFIQQSPKSKWAASANGADHATIANAEPPPKSRNTWTSKRWRAS